jgi:hypothetical protein
VESIGYLLEIVCQSYLINVANMLIIDTQSLTHLPSETCDCFMSLTKRSLIVNPFYTGVFTPLQLAVEHGCLDIVKYLVSVGADVNLATSKDGWTPLISAAHYNRYEIAGFLVDAGADLYAEDKAGRTAEEVAMANSNTALYAYFKLARRQKWTAMKSVFLNLLKISSLLDTLDEPTAKVLKQVGTVLDDKDVRLAFVPLLTKKCRSGVYVCCLY